MSLFLLYMMLISAKECSEKITALKNEISKLNKELAAMNELANSLASSMSDAKKIPGTQNENQVTITQPPKSKRNNSIRIRKSN